MKTFKINDRFQVSYADSPEENGTQIFDTKTQKYQQHISEMTPTWVRAALEQVRAQHVQRLDLEAFLEQMIKLNPEVDGDPTGISYRYVLEYVRSQQG